MRALQVKKSSKLFFCGVYNLTALYILKQLFTSVSVALRGFNDLGHFVTPTFFTETDFIYNVLLIEQKLNGALNPAILRLQGE